MPATLPAAPRSAFPAVPIEGDRAAPPSLGRCSVSPRRAAIDVPVPRPGLRPPGSLPPAPARSRERATPRVGSPRLAQTAATPPRLCRPSEIASAICAGLPSHVSPPPSPAPNRLEGNHASAHIQKRWAASYGLSALLRMLRRMGLSWQTTRPTHPKAESEMQEVYGKPRGHARRGRGRPSRTGAATAVRGRRSAWAAEPRGPEGPHRPSLVHPRRASRRAISQRPPGRRDGRFLSACIFAAVPRKCLRHFAGPAGRRCRCPATSPCCRCRRVHPNSTR